MSDALVPEFERARRRLDLSSGRAASRTERFRKLLVQFEVPTALIPLLALAMVVIVPPAVSGMAGWWSVWLHRRRVKLRAAWGRIVVALRAAVIRWLNGSGQ